jgi:hypothetical protein
MIGTTLGVLLGIAACAVLHWLFPDAAGNSYLDSAVVAAFGIVGMGMDILGRKKQKARDDD